MSDKKMLTVACESTGGFTAVAGITSNPAIIGTYEGIVQQIDTANQNKRRYTKKFWDTWLNQESTKEKLEGKLLLGQYSHPRNLDDGSFFENLTSHAITSLRVEGNNVMGKVEVFNTSAGRDVKVLLDAGVRLGVSSRALAVSEYNGEFEDINEGEIFGWDYVIDPSVKCAVLKPIGESLDIRKGAKSLMESIAKSNSDDSKVIMEALGYKKVTEEAVKEVVAEPVVEAPKEETTTEKEINPMESTEVQELLEKAAKEKVDLQEQLAKANEEVASFTAKIDTVKSNYLKMRESFINTAKDLRSKIAESSVKMEEVKAEADRQVQLADGLVGRMREKLNSTESTGEVLTEKSVVAIEKMRDMINDQKAKLAAADEMKARYESAITRLTAKVKELQGTNEEVEVKLAGEAVLKNLGQTNNDEFRSLVESCKSVKEVKMVEQRYTELHETMKEALPTEMIKVENIQREIEDELGKQVDPEVNRLTNVIKKSARR